MSDDGKGASTDGLSRGGRLPLPRLSTGGSDLLRGSSGGPAAGPGGDEGGEEQGVLARAVALRFPNLRELNGPERVSALVDHISDTAIMRAELEELRLESHVALRDTKLRLQRVPAAFGKTRAATDEARRAAAPEIAEEVDHYQWIIDRCAEQINRFGGSDYDAASRAYTLLSGA